MRTYLESVLKSTISFILILIAVATMLTAESNREASISVGVNFRIYPSNVSQTEVFAAVHPSNPDIMFASANTITFNPLFISEGVYVTTNGGVTWTGSDTCKGEPILLHNGDPGITIDKDGRFILVRTGDPSFFPGIFSHYSTDNGITWSFQNTIVDHDLERATVASDGFPVSNFYGRTYTTWVRFQPPYPIYFSYTDDGAVTWSSPAQINNPSKRGAGGDIDIGSDGTVYICWAGVADQSPFNEVLVGYASSTNGGATWTVNETAFAVNGIVGLLPQKQNIRVNGLPRIAVDNSGGPRHGWVYIVTTQKNLSPAGSDPDIILNRSTDGGATWSSAIRVNQDALNNGKIQYFPAIVVDDGGGVNIIYYDDRNTTSDSTGVFLSRSTDGGNTWTDFEISDHNFKPAPIGGLGVGYQGDDIDIAFTNNTLWPMWMDNSTGTYQIWTAAIDLSSVGIDRGRWHPSPYTFQLKQNYPNPFNPATTIEYRIPKSDHITVKVFDLRGKEIAVLVNEKQPAGVYRVEFDITKYSSLKTLSSGIYFYQLTASDFSETKRMLLIK